LKTSVESLGIFGGTPIFQQPLHVGRPNVGDVDRFMQRVRDALDRCWLTNDGPLVREFEQQVAQEHQVNHCVAMANGTNALEIACRALNITGEVILPAFTFVATAHALKWQGLTPVFCDVAPNSFHLDPARVEELITPQTSAIMGVHVWGEPCEIDALVKIAQKHNLKIVFDAAHAFGCSHAGQPIGCFGDAEILSFHGTKFVNSFEGGCILTNSDELAQQARLMRNFGFFGNDNVVALGTNAKMNEISAAMGLTSIESAAEFIDRNRAIYDQYRNGLQSVPGIDVFGFNENEARNFQYVVVQVGPQFKVTRDELIQVLEGEGVLARRYFYPGCHRMEPYVSELTDKVCARLSNTEKVCEQVMLLPTGTQLNPAEAAQIAVTIRFIQENVSAIKQKLAVIHAQNAEPM
jgi:dTDP-4-amino-4,6-dideoxygalactose transaminase